MTGNGHRPRPARIARQVIRVEVTLDPSREPVELRVPEAALRGGPCFQGIQARRVDGVDTALRVGPAPDQPCFSQHPKMMRDRRTGAREVGGYLLGCS
jgi:hypothetical protein